MIDDFIGEPVHCASGSREAYFGGGTKLTVLGKEYLDIRDFFVLFKNQTRCERCCNKAAG